MTRVFNVKVVKDWIATGQHDHSATLGTLGDRNGIQCHPIRSRTVWDSNVDSIDSPGPDMPVMLVSTLLGTFRPALLGTFNTFCSFFTSRLSATSRLPVSTSPRHQPGITMFDMFKVVIGGERRLSEQIKQR